jgi:radical SAM modification target selenobiotic family peptide
MEKDHFKKILAGLSLAGLIAGASPALGASATTEGKSS